MKNVDRSALFLHTEITEFRIFLVLFFISIYLYLRSRDIGIAYTDAPRRYRPSTRRRTPKISWDSPSISQTSHIITHRTPSALLPHRDLADICRANTEHIYKIIKIPRTSSQHFAKPRKTFGFSSYSSDNCYVLIYLNSDTFFLIEFWQIFIIIDLALSLCFPFPDLLKIVV